MSRMASLVALILVIVAGVAITGSGGVGRTGGAGAGFRAARDDLDPALDDIAAAVAGLETRVDAVSGPADTADLRGQLERVGSRRRVIVAKLDSLEQAGGDSWLGAMIGLRASVADLEYRVDALRLAAAGSSSALDSLFAAWFAGVTRSLDRAGHGIADSLAHSPGREGRMLLARVDSLEERYRVIAGRTADDAAARMLLGEELLRIRRRLRALSRSAHR